MNELFEAPTMGNDPSRILNPEKQDGEQFYPFFNPGLFSFFRSPVTNVFPSRTMNILEAYNLIKSESYATPTRVLRTIKDKILARNYKTRNFDYSTFAGVFSKRADKNLISNSGFITLDFDHVPNIMTLKDDLIKNVYFETVMIFVSPSGDGLKWILNIDLQLDTHLNWFRGISNYVKMNYKLEVDKSGKDVSRCCFLPYDPACYINTKYV